MAESGSGSSNVIGRFFAWWGGELAALIPAGIRRALVRGPHLRVIEFARNEIKFSDYRGNQIRELGSIPISDLDADPDPAAAAGDQDPPGHDGSDSRTTGFARVPIPSTKHVTVSPSAIGPTPWARSGSSTTSRGRRTRATSPTSSRSGAPSGSRTGPSGSPTRSRARARPWDRTRT